MQAEMAPIFQLGTRRLLRDQQKEKQPVRFFNPNDLESTAVFASAPDSRARPKVSQRIFFIFRVPEVAEMAAIWIKLHLVAQGFFERQDGFALDHEIVGVVHDLHFRIAAQPGKDAF